MPGPIESPQHQLVGTFVPGDRSRAVVEQSNGRRETLLVTRTYREFRLYFRFWCYPRTSNVVSRWRIALENHDGCTVGGMGCIPQVSRRPRHLERSRTRIASHTEECRLVVSSRPSDNEPPSIVHCDRRSRFEIRFVDLQQCSDMLRPRAELLSIDEAATGLSTAVSHREPRGGGRASDTVFSDLPRAADHHH